MSTQDRVSLRQRYASFVLAVAALCSVSACGTGGGGDDSTPAPVLTIQTATLPDGVVNTVYSSVQMQAIHTNGAVTWTRSGGAFPAGVTLSPAGVVSGTPTSEGSFSVTIEVTDASTSTSKNYTFDVEDFALRVTSGTTGGEAWSGAPVFVEAIGETGPVTFSVSTNGSAGSYSAVDNAAGTATWVPGATTSSTDTLRVVDDGTGAEATVSISVSENPAADHIARFGTTDVWWISTAKKRGTHTFDTDFLSALSFVGLLPSSPGSTEDYERLERLVEMTARVYLLREVNLIYLRNGDGTEGANGLAISFPYFQPNPSMYTAPPEAGYGPASANEYSIMEIADLASPGDSALGRAWEDPGNPFVEHDGGTDGDRLGTFVDEIADLFENWQSGMMLSGGARVSTADETIIADMLYDRPSSGNRHDTLDELMTWFMRGLALTTAHEIAHSVGLGHNISPDTLMYPSGGLSDSDLSTPNAVPFTASEVSDMRNTLLPGPNRGGSPKPTFGSSSSRLPARVLTRTPKWR